LIEAVNIYTNLGGYLELSFIMIDVDNLGSKKDVDNLYAKLETYVMYFS
jgi:hypothetical protein